MLLRPFRLFLPPNYPSATPTFDVSREWNTGNIGIVSKCLGLNAGFRTKIIQLFDLGYASRLRLIFCISAGFALCHIFISYVPTVEIIVEADGEQDEEDDDEEEEEEEEQPENGVVEQEQVTEDQVIENQETEVQEPTTSLPEEPLLDLTNPKSNDVMPNSNSV